MEFIHLPIPLEVVVRRNDGPGSRRMRLCQISYAFHPEASFGAIARAESGACAFGDCLVDVGRCSTRPWYALSATSQCGAALTGASQQGDPCADRSIRPDAVLRSGGDSSRADQPRKTLISYQPDCHSLSRSRARGPRVRVDGCAEVSVGFRLDALELDVSYGGRTAPHGEVADSE